MDPRSTVRPGSLSSQNQGRDAIAVSLKARATGSLQVIRSDFCRAASPATNFTAERPTAAIRATVRISSALALPRSGCAAMPITRPRGSTRNIPTREVPGRAITLRVTVPAPVLSHEGNPPKSSGLATLWRDCEGTLRAVYHRPRRHRLKKGNDQHALNELNGNDYDNW